MQVVEVLQGREVATQRSLKPDAFAVVIEIGTGERHGIAKQFFQRL
jgi:hypothetical protein